MKRSTIIWLIVAIVLIAVGALGSLITLASADYSFAALDSGKYEINTYDISEAFDEIYVDAATADVTFVYSNDGICRVECRENQKALHKVSVNDGRLMIVLEDNRTWRDHIALWSGEQSITVYLPRREYSLLNINADTSDISLPSDLSFDKLDVKVDTGDINCLSSAKEINMSASTGDITLEGVLTESIAIATSSGHITLSKVSCERDIALSVSTGRTVITDVTCSDLTSSGSTGDIRLTRAVASGSLRIERDTGDVLLENSDAGEIFIETSTGNVRGDLISDKIFFTSTDTGKIRVPKSTTGGKCEIITDTGDIIIDISVK